MSSSASDDSRLADASDMDSFRLILILSMVWLPDRDEGTFHRNIVHGSTSYLFASQHMEGESRHSQDCRHSTAPPYCGGGFTAYSGSKRWLAPLITGFWADDWRSP